MNARSGMRIETVTLADARAFVAHHHRYNAAPIGHKFSVALMDTSAVRHGVAIVGRPVARMLNDGHTLEVTRVCTDGTPNACSVLLASVWRAARELGFHRLVTYTQATETGASLRAAGWQQVAELRPRNGWTSTGRARQDKHPLRVRRLRWEVTTSAWKEGQFRNADNSDRYENPSTAQCATCSAPLVERTTKGRPSRYCSSPCRQTAYRIRRAGHHAAKGAA